MKKLLILLFISGPAMLCTVKAQTEESLPYKKVQVEERKPVARTSLREADVVYARYISRIIDTREKKNMVMNWPKNTLNEVVFKYLMQGESNSSGRLRAYANDSFTKPLTIAQVKKIGSVCSEIFIPYSPETPYDGKDSLVCTNFDITQIKRWQVDEVWLFDKQKGEFFPRIIAIAPLYTPVAGDVTLAEQPMFYIRYDELRPFLAQEEVFNRQNDAQRLSYYDLFEQRLFNSYIIKESNDKDLAIRNMDEYKDSPMEAMYVSEKVKQNLVNWESDLWEY